MTARQDIAFGEDGDVVSVWVGSFGSPEAVDAYTAEQYDRDGEPISQFAADVGLTYYDHDFLEVHHEVGMPRLGQAALARHSYGETFADAAAADLARSREFDTLLLLYGYAPTLHHRMEPSSRVQFVGTYRYTAGGDKESQS